MLAINKKILSYLDFFRQHIVLQDETPRVTSRGKGSKRGYAPPNLLDLQRGLTGERKIIGTLYLDNPPLLKSYLNYYWPISYCQASVVFAQPRLEALLKKFAGHKKIQVSELGAGCAPASLALLDIVGALASPPPQVALTLFDHSALSLEQAKEIAAHHYKNLRLEVCNLDLEKGVNLAGNQDVLIASHFFNELWGEHSPQQKLNNCLTFLRKLLGQLNEGGIFVIIEPSTTAASRFLLTLRDMLFTPHLGGLDALPLSILAPCPHEENCPVLQASIEASCHSDVAWQVPQAIADIALAHGLERTSVKMSYLVLQKKAASALTPELRGVGNELAPATPEEVATVNIAGARVISESMLNKAGRARFILCWQGRRLSFSAHKDDEAARRAGFFALARGSHIRVSAAQPRYDGHELNALAMLPETKITIESVEKLH